jgi:hypothetical protein
MALITCGDPLHKSFEFSGATRHDHVSSYLRIPRSAKLLPATGILGNDQLVVATIPRLGDARFPDRSFLGVREPVKVNLL